MFILTIKHILAVLFAHLEVKSGILFTSTDQALNNGGGFRVRMPYALPILSIIKQKYWFFLVKKKLLKSISYHLNKRFARFNIILLVKTGI